MTENAWWIAAISYLLGEHLAYQMTFTTYSHRPGYARYHLTGVLPDTLPPGADASFLMFDFAAGRTPGHDIHPVAALLASTGVMASGGLWRQAAAFASGPRKTWTTGSDRSPWRPGYSGSPCLLALPTRWPDGSPSRKGGCRPSSPTSPWARRLLTQPDGTLSSERLTDLLGLARRLASPAKVEQAERLLADQAIADLIRGEAADAGPVPEPGRGGRARPGR